ncbi:MAG: IPT/TIG domain-containing protein [Streptosporangiaceae bacterium]
MGPIRVLAVPLLLAGAAAWMSPAAQAAPATAAAGAGAARSAQPTVTKVSPGFGASKGGTRVTITGTHFVRVKSVKFGSRSGTSVKVMSSTKIGVTAPAGAAGVVDIRVTTSKGTSRVAKADHFTYIQVLVSGKAVTAKLAGSAKHSYLFAATAGSHVTFDVTETTLTATAVLTVYDKFGTYVTSIYVTASPTYLSLTPTESGTYKLVLAPYANDGATGRVEFTYAKDIQGGTLTSGVPVTTTIHYAGQQAIYSFAAKAGSHVTFDVTETTLTATAVLTVYDKFGTYVTAINVSDSATYLSLTPTESGTYKLVLAPYNGDGVTGAVLFTYAKDIQGGTLTSGVPVTTTIHYAGQQAIYSFAATAGMPVSIDITETTLTADAVLSVYDPIGTFITSTNVGSSPTSLTFTPSESGTYELVLAPYYGDGATGTVVFTYTTGG